MTVVWAPVRRTVAGRRRPVAALLAGLAVLFGLSSLQPPGGPTETVLAAARDLAAGTALTIDDLRPVALPAAAVPAGALRPGAAVLGRLVAGPVRSGEPLTDVRLVGPGLLDALAPGSVAVPVRFADGGAVALLRPGDRIDVLAAPPEGYAAALPADAIGLTDAAGPDGARHASPGPTSSSGTAPSSGAAPSSGGAPSSPRGAARSSGGAPSSLRGPGPAAPPAPAAHAVATDVVVLAVPTPEEQAYGDGSLVVVACSPAVARVLAAAAAHARLSPALRPPGAPP